MILFGQAPAPTSDALPRRVHRLETEEDTMGDRMTKRDIEQVVLDLLPTEPGASTSALSQIAGVASDRVFRVLLKLEKDGKIRREELPHGQIVVKRWFLK